MEEEKPAGMSVSADMDAAMGETWLSSAAPAAALGGDIVASRGVGRFWLLSRRRVQVKDPIRIPL